MYSTPEQVSEFNKSAVNAALQLTKIAFDTTERLVGLQLEASKESFADASETLRSLSEARDPQQMLDLRAKLTETGAGKVATYSRSLYDVAAHAQAQISALLEGHAAEWNQAVASNIDKAVKAAPVGSDVAIAAVKSTIAATTAAFDGVTKTAKQVASFADASVKATVDAATAAMKPAA
ncbi:MAG: phasin family protein [Betaproteobacteria bacterium]|nr:phasin family protein [Betaproteobacteria bacterium]